MMPIKVCRAIEVIKRRFLWGGNNEKRKLCLTRWATITRSKQHSGWGIIPIRHMNAALLCKWWWKFGHDRDALWRKVLISKCKANNNVWFPSSINGVHCASLWNGIISIGDRQGKFGDVVWNNLLIKVGSGKEVYYFGLITGLGWSLYASYFQDYFLSLANRTQWFLNCAHWRMDFLYGI